jgi:hypothetical protein
MSIELPRPARVLRPHLHGIVAENDSLFAHLDLGQGTPRREDLLYLPRRPVMVSVNEMDCLAGDLIAIEGDGLRAAHAEVSEEIEHVIRLDQRIRALQDGGVHLSRVRERTVAVANDIEVPQMKVGRKPSVSHNAVSAETLFSLIQVVSILRIAHDPS